VLASSGVFPYLQLILFGEKGGSIMRNSKSVAATFSAAALTVVSLATSSPAAPIHAAGVYSEFIQGVCDDGAFMCVAQFSKVPAEARIVRISCNFLFHVGNQGVQVNSTYAGFYTGRQFFQTTFLNLVGAFPSSYDSTQTQFQFLADVMYGVPAGSKPAVVFQYNKTNEEVYNCAINYVLP
jgi:hypothetical protein